MFAYNFLLAFRVKMRFLGNSNQKYHLVSLTANTKVLKHQESPGAIIIQASIFGTEFDLTVPENQQKFPKKFLVYSN